MDKPAGKRVKPHDRFFHVALENKKTAQEFLLQHLPKELSQMIDWETLESLKDSFVETNFISSEVDILHKVKIHNEEGYLYTLLEHQSRPDKIMSLRLWKYILAIMERYMKKAYGTYEKR